ncbi:TIGR02646 family protein [Oxalobacteraceae bacterium OTU3REALA1]|nr:TIGR02646 family protein [Oxalobacteraceae bacterium OTU3REALA1]
MHQLERDTVPPTCLAKHRHGTHPWSSLTPDERAEIWAKLNSMQYERCAYCEADLRKARHIEHFRQRRSYPQGTFEWSNLFGSCNRDDSCGQHKDHCGAYNHTDLIKPDIEDPEHFLLFAATGTVHARANLPAAARFKAEETIRVMNLNGALKQIRRTLLFQYLETAETLASMANEYGDEATLPFLENELRNTVLLPHATAIKHLLTRQSLP